MAVHVRPRGVTCRKISQYALNDAVAAVSGMDPSRHRLAVHYLLDRGPGTGPRYALIHADGTGTTAAEGERLSVTTLDGRTSYRVPASALAYAAEKDSETVDLANAIRPFHSDYDAQHSRWYAWAQS